MKLCTFTVLPQDRTSFGIWRDDGVVDLGIRLEGKHKTLHGLIAAGDLATAVTVTSGPADHAHADVRLDKPLLSFGKCLCVGVNYPDRNAEYKDGAEAPRYPSLFVRFPESFTGPDRPLIRPPESPQLDYEGEVALVIGRRGRRIPAGRWREHVLGYTIANEGTIRDWVRHGKFNVTPGKNWPASGALGPFLVMAAAVPDGALRVTTRVNGETRQDDTTDRMMFPFGRILEYVSTFCTLEPGDVILTGTPTGAGARFEPPRYLRPGDVVEVEVTGLGILRNTVQDEAPDPRS